MKNFIKPIDKCDKIVYTINVGATDDGCFSKAFKKITAVFEAGGYLFLLLQILITRLTIARMIMQNWKNNSQVMYIGITSPCRGRQKRY